MSAVLIDGKSVAAKLNSETAAKVAELAAKGKQTTLAVVLVGEDPASQVYVRNKIRTCGEVGIISREVRMSADSTTEEVLAAVRALNEDPEVDGILVQSPPPPQVDEEKVIEAIDPDKDVDCFAERNVGRLLIGQKEGFRPCTPWGVTVLLEWSGISTAGKNVVVLGRSNIVGKPMAALLLGKGVTGDATVTVCHSRTKDLADYTRRADIIIAAIGKPEFLKGDMVSEGVVVVDVGINRVPCETAKTGFKLVGDVAFDEVAPKAAKITPVPGGVGPMTIAMLMKNTIRACRRQNGL